MLPEGVRRGVGPVLLRVDAVVDHLHASLVEGRIRTQDVVAHRAGHGDDGVRALEARALAEGRQRVAPRPELLGLPRPERLEAVRGRDVRHAVEELRDVARQVRVPGVAVDERDSVHPGRHLEVDRHGTESAVAEAGRGLVRRERPDVDLDQVP